MQPTRKRRTPLNFPGNLERLLRKGGEHGLRDVFGKMGIDHQAFRCRVNQINMAANDLFKRSLSSRFREFLKKLLVGDLVH
jgi:hypothetical protein